MRLSKEETKPLNQTGVGLESSKLSRVGRSFVPEGGRSLGRGNVPTNRPQARGLLELRAQDEVVKQPGSFGIGRILQDGRGLGPGDELALGRPRVGDGVGVL